MALSENPFFPKVMQTVEMIASGNQQKEREDRRDQRLQDREDRAEERFFARLDEKREFEAGEKETEENQGRLNQAFTQIMQNRQIEEAGGKFKEGDVLVGDQKVGDFKKPIDPALQEGLSSIVKESIKKGGTLGEFPENIGMLKEKPAKESKKVKLDANVSAKFNLDPETEFDKSTADIYTRSYLKSLEKKEPKGDDLTADQKNLKDPGVVISKLRKGAVDRFNKGVKDKHGDTLGVSNKIYTQYLKELKELENKYLNGEWTDADQKKLNETQSFDLRRSKLKKTSDTLDTIQQKFLDEFEKINSGIK